jgi:hypothetical protein
MIQYPADSEPHIKWNHIDGPLLYCRNGRIHWLTLIERVWLKAGLTTIEKLDEKYCTKG